MDDNKLSQKNSALISNIIKKIKNHFGYFTVVLGNRDTFLGTNVERKKNVIHIAMIKMLANKII